MRNFVLLLLWLVSVRTFGQNGESLLIGPGDLIHVQVFDAPEFEQHARVNDRGVISLNFLGEIPVAGLTPSAASLSIQNALMVHGLLLHPQVTMIVDEYVAAKVSVSGEVHAPGMYSIMAPRSVLDVLSMAGGLTEIAARQILINHRRTGEQEPYFVSNDAGRELNQPLTVSPGDAIIVPRAGVVYAIGDFGHPGGYVMSNNSSNISLLELVARAGGIPPSGVPAHARLLRKQKNEGYIETSVPLNAIENGKRADIQLQADDIVYIPFSYLRNFAMNSSTIAASVGSAALYHF
jgi:polysaccharide export outer membrane protein